MVVEKRAISGCAIRLIHHNAWRITPENRRRVDWTLICIPSDASLPRTAFTRSANAIISLNRCSLSLDHAAAPAKEFPARFDGECRSRSVQTLASATSDAYLVDLRRFKGSLIRKAVGESTP